MGDFSTPLSLSLSITTWFYVNLGFRLKPWLAISPLKSTACRSRLQYLKGAAVLLLFSVMATVFHVKMLYFAVVFPTVYQDVFLWCSSQLLAYSRPCFHKHPAAVCVQQQSVR
ncbi:hypothetical protein RHMOL_Rhmol02G0084000 [Rhododendron molle]|nr:hypothetical protein RHMOL_Rhmol02G0084000 [Rhododendron molle]